MTMTRGDLVFLDTNILLSATAESHPDHEACREILRTAQPRGLHLVTTAQVLREYLVVATRPSGANGLGMAVADALHNINSFRTRVHVLPETAEVFAELLGLVERHGTTGKHTHDANIAAAMAAHRVRHLVTANAGDFAAFEHIALHSAAELAGGT